MWLPIKGPISLEAFSRKTQTQTHHLDIHDQAIKHYIHDQGQGAALGSMGLIGKSKILEETFCTQSSSKTKERRDMSAEINVPGSATDVMTLSIRDSEKRTRAIGKFNDESERRLSSFLSTMNTNIKRPRRSLSSSNASSFSSEADLPTTTTPSAESSSTGCKGKFSVDEPAAGPPSPSEDMKSRENFPVEFYHDSSSDNDTDCVEDEDYSKLNGV
jgi:hypothetical protein